MGSGISTSITVVIITQYLGPDILSNLESWLKKILLALVIYYITTQFKATRASNLSFIDLFQVLWSPLNQNSVHELKKHWDWVWIDPVVLQSL